MKTARLAGVCLLAMAAFAAYHFYLRGLMLDTGLQLGAVRPGKTVYRIVPLYIHARPRLKTGVLIAAATLAAFIYWARRAIAAAETSPDATALPAHSSPHAPREESRGAPSQDYSPARSRLRNKSGRDSRLRPEFLRIPLRSMPRRRRLLLAATFAVWQIAIAVSVALIDGGVHTLWKPYQEYHNSDYIGAVERIESPSAFLRDYPRLMPALPLHCRSHPPGGPLFLWLVAQLFGPGPRAASLATILTASLAAPAVYLLAAEVLSEAAARLAAALFLLAPNVVCYTATCLDAVFMAPLVWSCYFLYVGRRTSPLASGIAGGVAAALAALMTFSASFVALWSIVHLVATALFDRARWRNAAITLVAAVVTAAVFYGLLHAASGYEPLAVLRQAFAGQAEAMSGRGHSSWRQSAHFAVANLAAFLFCAGVPVSWLWLRQTMRECRRDTSSAARCLLVSFGLTLLLIDLAPLYTLETERIWIFLLGFLAIGAAARLAQTERLGASPLIAAALAFTAAQTIVMEALFDWRW